MVGFEPGDCSDGLLRIVEILVAPEWGRGRAGGEKIRGVLGVGDLSGREVKCVDPDFMYWAFAILTDSRAHEKPGRRNGDQGRFDIKCVLRVRVGGGHWLRLDKF